MNRNKKATNRVAGRIALPETEVLCDIEGIDSFLDRYESLLPEAADAFAEALATQIADSLRAIHAHLPSRSDEVLDRASELVNGSKTNLAPDDCENIP